MKPAATGLRTALALLGGCLFPLSAVAQDVCSFDDWAWHSANGKAEDYQSVVITRDELSRAQHHPTLPCSVCKEDQVEITLSNGVSVEVCHILAEPIEMALEETLASGFPIETLKGYRVGRTRGPLDERGLRTEYSNHSFGLALDVNADANGLYDRCVEWGPECRLRRGGHWAPNNPHSITRDNGPYLFLEQAGLKWGGELQGRQKDFMHFSPTGG